MATTLIKDKLSKIVRSQLPEFVQNDYPTFVSFIQAYYEFLEQDQNAQELLQNIFNYNNIDKTIDSFIAYFKKNYIPQLPESTLADERVLVKNIKDLYSNKGNEKSYSLLIKILLNKNVSFDYPGRRILIASDGRWKQDVSIFVRVITGSSEDIVGKKVNIVTVDAVKDFTVIKEKRDAYENIGDQEYLSTEVFEYVIDNSNNPRIAIDDLIELGAFRGKVIATTTSIKVLAGGTNFRVGQTYRLINGNGTRSVIRISEIGPSGSVSRVELVRFGIGYESDFLYNFAPGLEVTPLVVFFISGNTFNINDVIDGFTDRGYINSYDYTASIDSAFDPSYCGTIIRTFFNDTRETSGATGDNATIEVSLGAKAKYPGFFSTNNGFLSDDIYLQDQDFYQPFSYVLELDEQFNRYKKAILDILHPAGLKVFGEFDLLTDVGISANVDAVITTV